MELEYQAVNYIKGRYIILEDVENVLSVLSVDRFQIDKVAKSVENRDLYTVRFGHGKKKIILWSHMHGNEGTTTKAVLDWLSLVNKNESYYKEISSHCTFCILPMVNPDGAFYYTRVNANQVDLNRDSVALSQPESMFLNQMIREFAPDLALNLHDQRTIFGVGKNEKPATISFLAPAFNDQRDVNETRTIAMQLIAAMYTKLNEIIPNQIGRFDDSFNINCIGDCVTHMGIPTILFEAGHYPDDYQREETRKIVFEALCTLFDTFKTEDYAKISTDIYWNIEENAKTFNDVRIEGVGENLIGLSKNGVICLQYVEKVHDNNLFFEYSVDFESAPNAKYGHKILNAKGLKFNSINEIYSFLDENLKKLQ